MHAEKWVYGGESLARLDGRVVLTPFLLPGESARVEIASAKSDLLRGRVQELLTRNQARQDAPCPVFGACGGCHYQHASYEFQVAGKVDILREQLRRVGKIDWTGEIEAITAGPWRYRNRVQVRLAASGIGYMAWGTHDLIPTRVCPISWEPVEAAIQALWKMRNDSRFPGFLRTVELFTNGEKVQLNVLETDRKPARWFFDWCAEMIPGAADPYLDYNARGFDFRVSHDSFFQVNRLLVDRLPEAAIGDANGASAVDLYAGVGLFSLELTRRFQDVTAVESIQSAARDLEYNAGRAARGVRVVKERVEEYLARLEEAPDFILADPPRAGLGKIATRQLLRLRPNLITIVSCDPATLARDLSFLTAGGYRIESVAMIDLFPQTYHIESIVRLRRE
ncbi:MAG: RsmD family RNA methyltransferase [Bryobacteraceae bacterium]|nr:RsmD family RNA methyltransferase [Bryobacteraceae bacterium]